MKLTKYELETTINWNLEDDLAYISTRMPAVMRRMEKMGLQPSSIHKDSVTKKIYGKDYEIPKKYIRLPRIPTKRVMTDEQKLAGAKRLAKARNNKAG